MSIIVQLYILVVLRYIILLRSAKDILSDNQLRNVFAVLAYALILRVTLGFNVELPFIFHESIFLAYALFVPSAYLYLRHYVSATHLTDKDLIHLVPFLTLAICSFVVSVYGTNVQAEIQKIWSFTSEHGYNAKSLMPLFLFIYCFTAFYLYQIVMLFKNSMLTREEPIRQSDVIKLPVNAIANNDSNTNDTATEKTEIQHHAVISHERMAEIDVIVRDLLNDKKPYLQQRYSLKDLATDTNIPLHHLSAFINKYWGKNFNDFINEFRVHYCKEKILNEEYKFKKLEAIAEESGFNNRNTFAIAFKKVMGLNPSEFLRNLKSSDYESVKPYEFASNEKYLQRV